LKQALDFKQLGHDRVACHCRRVDDSSVAQAIKTARFPSHPLPRRANHYDARQESGSCPLLGVKWKSDLRAVRSA
jgi:hypothetical protein